MCIRDSSYANSPHKFVEKWDTPMLIFTGEYDFRIPYTCLLYTSRCV